MSLTRALSPSPHSVGRERTLDFGCGHPTHTHQTAELPKSGGRFLEHRTVERTDRHAAKAISAEAATAAQQSFVRHSR